MAVALIPTMEFHEVANIFPLIEGQEFDNLVEDIRANGLQQPIWTYQGKIIDGRNRYRACVASEVEPRFQEWDGNGSLVAFTISLNVKRRHLTSSQLGAIAMDVLPLFEKEAADRQIALAGTRPNTNPYLPQNFAEGAKGESADQIAQMLGTNHDYVRAAKKIAEEAPELIEYVKDGTLTVPDAKEIAPLPESQRSKIIEKVVQRKEEAGKRVSSAVRMAIWEETGEPMIKSAKLSALQSSESNEWYTPAEYIEAARKLMRGIDLDPASCEEANRTVKAEKFYTKKKDGLNQPWRGRIWLNPPYGFDYGSNQERWSRTLIERFEITRTVTEAVLLVNANTEAKWFQPLYRYLICFTDHRIRFNSAEGASSQPTQGNALIYFGRDTEQQNRFIELFSQFGEVVERARTR